VTEAEARKLWMDVYVTAIGLGATSQGAKDKADMAVKLAMARWS
jgi:hypothetical protein